MKRKGPLTINIPDACTQSWNDMTPMEDGRFCQHCQKKVTDFSTMTDQEIIAILSSNEEHLCGRFLSEQLDRNLREPKQSWRSFLPAAMLTSLIAVVTPDSSEAKELADATVQSVTHKIDSVIKGNPSALFTGEIIDSLTCQPLSGVTVLLKDDATGDLGTLTDYRGRFRINIPDEFRRRPLTFKVSYLGYDVKEICFDVEELRVPATIQLQQSIVNLEGITIYGYPVTTKRLIVGGLVRRRLTWWERVEHFFRRKIHNHADCYNQ